MARNRLWVIGSVAAMIAIALLTWFIGIQPQLQSIASINAERQSVEAQNAAEQHVLDQLEKDADDEARLRTEYDLASKSVPAGTGVPAFIDQLNALAASTGVSITRITVSDAAPFEVAAPAEPAAPTDASADASTDASTGASGGSASGGGADASAAAPAATNGLITPANFAYLQIGIEIDGEYAKILDFVHGLQTGERLMLVNDVKATAASADDGPSSDGEAAPAPTGVPSYTASISGLIYSLVNAGTVGSTSTDTGAQEAAGSN